MKTKVNYRIMLQKFILSISFMLTTWLVNAQTFPVQVTPQLIPSYSAKLSDYTTITSEKLFANILLTDVNEVGRRVRLKMYIEGQGLSITTQDVVNGAAPIFVDGGVNLRLSNLDLQPYFQLNNLLGITPQQYNNPLPDGAYTYCFEVYDFFTGRLLSNRGCTTIFILKSDPPFLNLPFRDNIVNATNPQNVLFTWTPRHSNLSDVQYEFTLKELWDNQNPQAIFLGSIPFYQTTTRSTTLLVGPEAPQMIPGKVYGWQVRAFVSDGIEETSVFKNDGRSEIFWFKYLEDCLPPSFVISQALTAESVRIEWQTSDHIKYRIQYRKKGFGDNDWFEVDSYTTDGNIYNLEPDTVYEFRVGGECTPLSGFAYSNIQEFTTPTNDEAAYYNCGLTPQIDIKNQDPLPSLKVNEAFTAGDFPVITREVSGGNGSFSGWGYITLPFLENLKEIIDAANIASGGEINIGKYTRIKVKFENVRINTSKQLIEGVVVTDYDPDWGGILDADEIINDIAGDNGNISTYDATNLDIATVEVSENGDIVITTEDGEQQTIISDVPVVITDQNGDQWTVDEQGNVTEGAAAEGGQATSANTNGVSGSGNVNEITSKDVEVEFIPSGYYGIDQYNDKISSDKYKDEYEFIKTHDNKEYPVLYKFITDKPKQTDVIKAKVSFANGKTKEDIVFKTKQGSKVDVSWSTDEATITLKRQFDFGKDEIIATVKPKEKDGKYDVAGKLDLWHAQQREINLTLVSIDGAPLTDVGKRINEIYNKAGVHFKITEENLSLNLSSLDVGDSDLLSHYTNGEKNIIEAYKSSKGTKSDQYYMFFVKNSVQLSKQLEGFMPLKRQFGFVFTENDAGRIASHEIGHGIFGLKHPWDQYSYEDFREETEYLMDYGSGTKFTHMDWQKLHAPGIQLYWFQGDEAGESVITTLHKSLAINEVKYKCEDGNCVKSVKGKYYYGYLTPSGKRIVLSQDYFPIFYHGIGNDKYTHIVPGTLIGFRKRADGEAESIKYVSSLSSDGENFSGYNNNFEYLEDKLEGDDNSVVIGLPYGGNSGNTSKWKNYKFVLKDLKKHTQGEQKVLKVTSNEFKSLGLFSDNVQPTRIKKFDNISKILGEEQVDVTESELKILRGRYFEVPNITDFTTLIEGILTVGHDEKPEVFLLIKIAEIQNRYPFLFDKYSRWFDQWNVYALTQKNYLSVSANIIARISAYKGGEWDKNNVTQETIESELSDYRKWKDNIANHNSKLYDFYKKFTIDLRNYTDSKSESNFECLNNLKNKTADEIYACIELASDDELKLISQENRQEALRIIANDGNTDDYLRDREETVVQRLIKYVPSSFNTDTFIKYLTDTIISLSITSQYGTTTYFDIPLWEVLFDKIDDSKFLYPGDNRNAIMLQLLNHYYNSSLYETDVKSVFLDYQEKVLGQPVSAIKALNEQLYTFKNDYQNILRRGFTHFKNSNAPGGIFYDPEDFYFSIDAEIKQSTHKIHLKQKLKWGFTSQTLHEDDFGPFDLSLMMNLSKESLLNGFSLKDKEGKPQSVPLPAIILYYASEVGNEQTKSDIIQSVIDLATLPIPAANLTKLGKVFYYADKISSVSSLLATANRENNPELSKFYNKLSLVTGVTSIGDMLTPNKLLKTVIPAEYLAKSANDIVEDVIKFTDEIENTPIDKLSAVEIGAGRRILEGNLEDFRALDLLDEAKEAKIVNAINKLESGLDFDISKHLVVLGNDIDLARLAKFENENVDGILDLVIHGSAERFMIDGNYVDNVTDIADWLKKNKPDMKEIRLLSCTSLDSAQELVDHLGEGYKVYATDGFVRVYNDGSITSVSRNTGGDSDWYKLEHNVEKSTEIPENARPRGPDKNKLDDVDFIDDFIELSNRTADQINWERLEKLNPDFAATIESRFVNNLEEKAEFLADLFHNEKLSGPPEIGIASLLYRKSNMESLKSIHIDAWRALKEFKDIRRGYFLLDGFSHILPRFNKLSDADQKEFLKVISTSEFNVASQENKIGASGSISKKDLLINNIKNFKDIENNEAIIDTWLELRKYADEVNAQYSFKDIKAISNKTLDVEDVVISYGLRGYNLSSLLKKLGYLNCSAFASRTSDVAANTFSRIKDYYNKGKADLAFGASFDDFSKAYEVIINGELKSLKQYLKEGRKAKDFFDDLRDSKLFHVFESHHVLVVEMLKSRGFRKWYESIGYTKLDLNGETSLINVIMLEKFTKGKGVHASHSKYNKALKNVINERWDNYIKNDKLNINDAIKVIDRDIMTLVRKVKEKLAKDSVIGEGEKLSENWKRTKVNDLITVSILRRMLK
ncbi:fibronectin type III domain-containing protein [Tenacibaculum agarivorans]|uniref:fibronectin type III domain-containing protein n=1 Tax=Tenacibaculum agarivorans TaxID=1908389 RepID=UPI0009F8E398|nr:fibronectin type III domain-containing protein [Tenacibaculum agarivorans]